MAIQRCVSANWAVDEDANLFFERLEEKTRGAAEQLCTPLMHSLADSGLIPAQEIEAALRGGGRYLTEPISPCYLCDSGPGWLNIMIMLLPWWARAPTEGCSVLRLALHNWPAFALVRSGLAIIRCVCIV
jgi:hypothetical protein